MFLRKNSALPRFEQDYGGYPEGIQRGCILFFIMELLLHLTMRHFVAPRLPVPRAGETITILTVR